MDKKIEDIYREYKDIVYYFLNIKLKNKAVAEELTQEVFLKVFKSLYSYRGEASIKNWVLTIARNEFISYVRKNKKFQFEELPYEQLAVNNKKDENPEAYISCKENSQMIYNILDKLNDDQRNALILFDIEQLSYKEIANKLNWSLAKVKVTIYRARIKFRQLYEKVDNYEL